MAKGSAGESALSRAMSILDVFSGDSPFLTLSEISRRSHRPLSTTHRIVSELLDQGLLEYVYDQGRRRYRLGNRLWELGARTPEALGLREIAQPYLAHLHRHLGQHVQIAVPYETDALVLDRISDPNAVINATVIGGHMPMEHTALGLVLIAHGPEGLIEKVTDRGLHPQTTAGIHTPEQLRKAVDGVKQYGYAVTNGYIVPGSRGIAVPIGAPDVVVAALGVVVPNDGTSPRPIASALLRTAAAIGRRLSRPSAR